MGTKNTLNFNYLPDAKAHGAEIFVEVICNLTDLFKRRSRKVFIVG